MTYTIYIKSLSDLVEVYDGYKEWLETIAEQVYTGAIETTFLGIKAYQVEVEGYSEPWIFMDYDISTAVEES